MSSASDHRGPKVVREIIAMIEANPHFIVQLGSNGNNHHKIIEVATGAVVDTIASTPDEERIWRKRKIADLKRLGIIERDPKHPQRPKQKEAGMSAVEKKKRPGRGPNNPERIQRTVELRQRFLAVLAGLGGNTQENRKMVIDHGMELAVSRGDGWYPGCDSKKPANARYAHARGFADGKLSALLARHEAFWLATLEDIETQPLPEQKTIVPVEPEPEQIPGQISVDEAIAAAKDPEATLAEIEAEASKVVQLVAPQQTPADLTEISGIPASLRVLALMKPDAENDDPIIYDLKLEAAAEVYRLERHV